MSRIPVRPGKGALISSVALKARQPLLRSKSEAIRGSHPIITPPPKPESDDSDSGPPPTPDLPWMVHIRELQGELDAVWREEQLIDLSAYSAFAVAARGLPPTDDALEDARALMDAGFAEFHARLERKKRLQLRAMALLEELRHERERHSPDVEFTADTDPQFDPDVE